MVLEYKYFSNKMNENPYCFFLYYAFDIEKTKNILWQTV